MAYESGRPDLSIVIATRNTRELLRACLRSIPAGAGGISVESIVVDNGSADESLEMLAAEFPDVRTIRNEGNRGFAEANNQGIAAATGRAVMLLNSDTEVERGALATLVRYLDDRPAVGACAPRLRYPDGRIQRTCFSFETPWRHWLDMLAIGHLVPGGRMLNLATRFDHDATRAVEWVAGAALVVRREVIDRVGGLDERFAIHCNDSDWCYRIHRAGWELHFVHEAEVVHHSGATIRQEQRASDIDEEMLRNLFDYYRKYWGRAGVAWLRLWMVVGFGARRAMAPLLGGRGEGWNVGRQERMAIAGLFGVRRRGAIAGGGSMGSTGK